MTTKTDNSNCYLIFISPRDREILANKAEWAYGSKQTSDPFCWQVSHNHLKRIEITKKFGSPLTSRQRQQGQFDLERFINDLNGKETIPYQKRVFLHLTDSEVAKKIEARYDKTECKYYIASDRQNATEISNRFNSETEILKWKLERAEVENKHLRRCLTALEGLKQIRKSYGVSACSNFEDVNLDTSKRKRTNGNKPLNAIIPEVYKDLIAIGEITPKMRRHWIHNQIVNELALHNIKTTVKTVANSDDGTWHK